MLLNEFADIDEYDNIVELYGADFNLGTMDRDMWGNNRIGFLWRSLYNWHHHYIIPELHHPENHVGVEFEGFAPQDNDLFKYLVLNELCCHVQIGDDYSIRNVPHGFRRYELAILMEDWEMLWVMRHFNQFLQDAGFQVNEFCGFHVHVDMRHRNYNVCFERLQASQRLLYNLVAPNRHLNPYCRYTRNMEAPRRSAINPSNIFFLRR